MLKLHETISWTHKLWSCIRDILFYIFLNILKFTFQIPDAYAGAKRICGWITLSFFELRWESSFAKQMPLPRVERCFLSHICHLPLGLSPTARSLSKANRRGSTALHSSGATQRAARESRGPTPCLASPRPPRRRQRRGPLPSACFLQSRLLPVGGPMALYGGETPGQL